MTELTFEIKGINHLGLAVKDREKAQWFFQQILGLKLIAEEFIPPQNTNTIIYSSRSKSKKKESPAARLELLESNSPDSAVQKFLQKKGGGIHHLALTVDSAQKAFQYLKSKGIQLVNEKPERGAHNTTVFFVHPHATGGILIEFVEQI